MERLARALPLSSWLTAGYASAGAQTRALTLPAKDQASMGFVSVLGLHGELNGARGVDDRRPEWTGF